MRREIRHAWLRAAALVVLPVTAGFSLAPPVLAQAVPGPNSAPSCAVNDTGGASPLSPANETGMTINGKPLYTDAPTSYNIGVAAPTGCEGNTELPPDMTGGGPNASQP